MFDWFKKKEKIHKLIEIKSLNISIQKLKKEIKIAIIDDQNFPPKNKLQNLGFNITYFKDISSLDLIKDFPVIICDIKGIGQEFGGKYEGAFVISEIRKTYPDKYIIAYSTESYGLEIASFIQKADIIASKGATVEEWSSILEKAIKHTSDASIRWKKTRASLLDNGIELSDLLELEQKYILSINNGKNEMEDTSILNRIENSLILDIIKGFISSALIEILKYYTLGKN
ncbi:hypothetical protein [Pasteurella multocida]|uniref:hypothetical protein n=1 Tax=Pasteurella multocida TaxID=747 RepID=UPI000E06B196|nr:hypothetical protein [Pasteurella multocida]SUB38815.1 Uncharacterised protein [Pasteurella multocida]HDR0634928.1 hypothetical protein [Pasteurella multocida]HDR1239481.1 hypothetical protein [Pasteurella multocida]